MNIFEINAARLDILTGPVATVRAPADLAAAVSEVDSKPVQAWPPAVHDEIDSEVIGGELVAAPYNW